MQDHGGDLPRHEHQLPHDLLAQCPAGSQGVHDKEPGAGAVTPQGHGKGAGDPPTRSLPSALGLGKVQQTRNSGVPGSAERDRRKETPRAIGREVQQDVGVGEPRPILIQPYHGTPIGSRQGDGMPQIPEDLRSASIVARECERTPEPAVSSPSIGFQVDDVELAHRFQV